MGEFYSVKDKNEAQGIQKILINLNPKDVKRIWKKWSLKTKWYLNERYSQFKNRNKIDFKCKYRWFGSDYGGFYVCTSLLNKKSDEEIIVYSGGIGIDISFDRAILSKYKNARVFAFDPTPVSLNWLKEQNLPKKFEFYPIGLGHESGTEIMYLPEINSSSFSAFKHDPLIKNTFMAEMETINNLMKKNKHQFVDILKLDIEGSEFGVIESMDLNNVTFGQILIEFHERFFPDEPNILKNTIDKLKSFGYYCFAISSNYEYGFVNKKLYEQIH